MKSQKAILPVVGGPAAAPGAAVIVRPAAASAAATARVPSAATARLMSVLLDLGDLAIGPWAPLAGWPPVGEERDGHAGAHRAPAGAVGVHDREELAAFAAEQDDPPPVRRVTGEATLPRRSEVGEFPQAGAVRAHRPYVAPALAAVVGEHNAAAIGRPARPERLQRRPGDPVQARAVGTHHPQRA